MAIIKVTSTADSGSGSLRQAIADAATGDTIVFDSSLEVDGVITIALETSLHMRLFNVTIDGGGHWNDNGVFKTRVVLDGQNATRLVNLAAYYRLIANDITFLNGNVSGNGGGVNTTTGSQVKLTDCVFNQCYATAGSAAVMLSTSTGFFKNVYAYNCTGSETLYTGTTGSFEIKNFTDSSNLLSVYVRKSTDGSLIIEDCILNRLSFYASTFATVKGAINTNVFNIANEVSITFSNESELVVTNSATIGTATFTAESGDSATATFPAGTSLTSATWTNVATTLVVQDTADSGTNSLRTAISNAVLGTTITFDDALEDDGVITIALDTSLAFQYANLIIDGGGHTGSGKTLQTRVILDIQKNNRIVVLQNGTRGLSLKDITLLNGKATTQGANAATGYGTNSFDYCVFQNGTSTANAGGVACVNASINSFVDCLFKNCVSNTNGGGLYSDNTSQNTFTNCTFDACSSAHGGGLYSTGTSQNSLTDCTFDACSSPYGGGLYSYITSQNTLTNCVFIPPENNTNTTIHNVGTNNDGSLIINGSIICDKVHLVSNSTTIINGKLTVETLIIGNSTLITFSGVDSILAATTTASIGSATFTAAEGATGYLALPNGTTAPTVGTGVKVATYGAEATRFTAFYRQDGNGGFNIAKTNAVPVLLERQDDGEWTTLSVDASSETVDADPTGGAYRIFDGARFLTATAKDFVHNGFYVINDWADQEWNITSWVEAESSGGDGRDDACAFTVDAWAIDPELYD